MNLIRRGRRCKNWLRACGTEANGAAGSRSLESQQHLSLRVKELSYSLVSSGLKVLNHCYFNTANSVGSRLLFILLTLHLRPRPESEKKANRCRKIRQQFAKSIPDVNYGLMTTIFWTLLSPFSCWSRTKYGPSGRVLMLTS